MLHFLGLAAEWCSITGGVHYERSEHSELPRLNFQAEACLKIAGLVMNATSLRV